jgi:hypothetical protein
MSEGTMGQNTRRIELVIAASRRRPAASPLRWVAGACHLNILIIRNICRSSVMDG